MSDLRTLLRSVEEVRAPDLWAEISVRALAPAPAPPVRRRRLAPRLVPLAAAVAAIVAAVVTLVPRPPSAFAIVRDAIEDFARISPFRATIVGPTPNQGPGAPSSFETLEVSYRDANAWRVQIVDAFPELERPTNFNLWDGERFFSYDAFSNAYTIGTLAEGYSPLGLLSWDQGGIRFWKDRCAGDAAEVLGDETVAGRAAHHVRCGELELWIDADTGLMLRIRSNQARSARPEPFPGPIGLLPGTSVEITSVEFNPEFGPDVFRFDPPDGARHVDEIPGEEQERPPAPTIRPGSVAPSWRGPLLSGGELSTDDLRGKPSAVYFWGSWCEPCVGERLNVLQSALESYGDRMHVGSVTINDDRAKLKETVDRYGYTFPVVLDNAAQSAFGAIGGAWGIQSVPALVLLDSEGRVVAVFGLRGGITADELRADLQAFAEGRPLPPDKG